jgi:hypothetical protein
MYYSVDMLRYGQKYTPSTYVMRYLFDVRRAPLGVVAVIILQVYLVVYVWAEVDMDNCGCSVRLQPAGLISFNLTSRRYL